MRLGNVEKWQKARVNHLCEACQEAIKPKELYLTVVIFPTDENEFSVYKMCHACYEVEEYYSYGVRDE